MSPLGKFYRDIRGKWYKCHEAGMTLITDEDLIDMLELRKEPKKLVKGIREGAVREFAKFLSTRGIAVPSIFHLANQFLTPQGEEGN